MAVAGSPGTGPEGGRLYLWVRMNGSGDSLLRNVRFMRLWVGQGISFVGDYVSMVALVILVVDISGSATAVGGVLVARLLPTLASPLFGVLADRLDRRVVLVASDLARAVLVLGLVFVRDLIALYVLAFLIGLARAFFTPTVRAAFPSVVAEGNLTKANAIISGTFSVSITLGPALGGLLVTSVGVNAAFVLDSATYLISAILLSRIPLPRPQGEREGTLVRELRAGFAYLGRARVPMALVMGAFLLNFTTDLTVPAEAFLARETFGAGSVGYGLLVSVWGGGMIVGSALAAVLENRLNLIIIYLVSIFIWGLALVGTGLAPAFVIALGALAVAGVSNGVDNVATDTVLQRRVPDVFLGRVFSVRFLGYTVGEALAYQVGGLTMDATGPRFVYLVAGVATAAAGLLILTLLATASTGKR
ncbi:MAG: MFS transporter [Rubrobacteraceae bacterium]